MGCGDGAGKRDKNGFRNDTEMKIMIFSIKSDKFTGFFDKFLKIHSLVTDCKTNSYHKNLSATH